MTMVEKAISEYKCAFQFRFGELLCENFWLEALISLSYDSGIWLLYNRWLQIQTLRAQVYSASLNLRATLGRTQILT